jgi:hypothetical protein
VIRIDVHHVGETPTNMTRTLPTPVDVCPACTSYGQSPYMATFHETSIDLDRSHYSWEEGLLTQSTARRLTDPWVHTQLLSRASQWSRGRKPISCRRPTNWSTGPISPACDQYIQYLLTGTNPSVLNWHRRGYHIENIRIATALSPPFPSESSTNPPNGPTRSQII